MKEQYEILKTQMVTSEDDKIVILRQQNLTEFSPVKMMLTHAKARHFTGESGKINNKQGVLPTIIFKDTI